MLQAGTNNLPSTGSADKAKVDEVVAGIKAIIGVCQQQAPQAAIVLTGVFPRSQNMSLKETIEQINTQLSKLDDGKRIRFLNINDKLADTEGKLLAGMSSDGLHLEAKGYDVWAEALNPILTEIMGPPAAEDHAPPPTGDPSAAQAPPKDVASRPSAPRAVEVPDAVRIKRPTAKEVAIAEKALADFKESADPQIKAVLKEFPTLVEVRVPRPNSAIVPGLAPFFRQKHQANVAVAKEGKAELLLDGRFDHGLLAQRTWSVRGQAGAGEALRASGKSRTSASPAIRLRGCCIDSRTAKEKGFLPGPSCS